MSLPGGTAHGTGSTAFPQVSLKSTIKNIIQLLFVHQAFTFCSSILLLSMRLLHATENQELTTVCIVGNHTVEALLPLSLM